MGNPVSWDIGYPQFAVFVKILNPQDHDSGMIIQSKSIYAAPESSDGVRVLMDRHWPRGLTREKASLDFWARELAPSAELAAQLKEDDDFAEFAVTYRAELAASDSPGDFLDNLRDASVITILYAASNKEKNHATVLRAHLAGLVPPPDPVTERREPLKGLPR